MPILTPLFDAPPGRQMPVMPTLSHLPLAGLTILAVEDSRFASEALRLLCNRSGARLRRAETMGSARQHLRTYRPDVVIVDLGLPDGSGLDLIADLALEGGFSGTVLATSGDPSGKGAALGAGALGFLEKPLESLTEFQATILELRRQRPPLAAPAAKSRITPDRQALRDDLARAADLIAEDQGTDPRYIADFVRGLARSSHDPALEHAARAARTAPPGAERLTALQRALSDRLSGPACPFS
jgi:DNA-binding NarL/FixJ family response regulator